ncbi:MAG: uroporphyrinogen-III C-methyltransferase [Burkholderiaceae bacterium]
MTRDASDSPVSAPARSADGPAGAASPQAAAAAAAANGRRAADRVGLAAAALDPRRTSARTAWIILAVVVLIAVASVWYVQGRVERVERDLARRLQASEVRDQQTEQQLRLLSDTLRDAQGKTAVLEAKLADTLGQQAQLRQLYDEMARNRGDLMLADVENSIMIAAQQLQLGGNVQSALLAMQDAEQVLARSNQPTLIGLRRVLSRDIERLKSVPLADFTAAVNRLDAVIGMVEQMPLLVDLPPANVESGVTRPEGPSGLRGIPERVARTSQQGWEAFITELRSLFRVQRVDQPEALLLAPDQRFFARETVRLQLLNARLNLLARNEALFRSDLARAISAIDRWFDGRHKTVLAAQGALRQLQSTRLAIDLPSLAESIGAVRAARAASDAR